MPVTRTAIGLELDANGPQVYKSWPQNNLVMIDRLEWRPADQEAGQWGISAAKTQSQRLHDRPSHTALKKNKSSEFIPGTAKIKALELEPEPELDIGG